MKVVMDLDGTINADPEFYRSEMAGLMQRGHEVHVVTGNPQAHQTLAQLGMVKGRDFTHVAVVPRKHIGRVKVAYMKRVGATHIVDNRHKTVKRARHAGFTAHHHLHPKKES